MEAEGEGVRRYESDRSPNLLDFNCTVSTLRSRSTKRILGGIGVVLEWWPIKAYRPCPNLVERGGEYVRSGQGLDEIAFGRDPTFSDRK